MKKTYKLEGLDCAHCASKIESGINKISGVKQATVNFMLAKLIVEVEDENSEAILEEVKAMIHKFEPDVVIKRA